MAVLVSFNNAVAYLKQSLQLPTDGTLISDDDLKAIMANAVEGEFSTVNPRRVFHIYQGNDEFRRELPHLWVKNWSSVHQLHVNSKFVDKSNYRILECDESERFINDSVPGSNTVTLLNSDHSNFFKSRDVVAISNTDSIESIGSAIIGIATIGGFISIAGSALSGYDILSGSIILQDNGNAILEVNWITGIDSDTGILTLKNNISQAWTSTPILKRLTHLEIGFGIGLNISSTDQISIEYSTVHVFDETEVTFIGNDYDAYLNLCASKICRAIAARFTRFLPETFTADAVDRSGIVSLWEGRADDYLKRFRDYFGVNEDMQNSVAASAGVGNDRLKSDLGLNSVFSNDPHGVRFGTFSSF